mgnify:CR=1 FL=1
MSIIGDILGFILILGGFISYYFQIHKLYKFKNTQGLDLTMVIFGVLGSYFNLLGIIGLNLNHLFSNCNGYKCISDILPIVQFFSPWICYEIIYVMFYYYDNNVSKIIFTSVHICYILFLILIVTISQNKDLLTKISIIYNILASILSIIMWLPQIKTAINEKQEGSLSLWSVGTHSLGCVFVVLYQENQQMSNFIKFSRRNALHCWTSKSNTLITLSVS